MKQLSHINPKIHNIPKSSSTFPFWDTLSTFGYYEAFNGNKIEHVTIITSL